jgi:putative peptidoglycan lipid II flippase
LSRLARATALMTFGTVLSRLTGVIRLAAIAAALGVVESKLPDTYNLANTVPNIIYELVLGGVLTSVFVPVFVELLANEGRERAWSVASAILNVSLVVLTAITVLGILAAPFIARFYASGLEGDQARLQEEVLTFVLRLFLPQIIFYGLAAITAGLLNAHRHFGPPMYTPVLNNLAVIAVFVGFYNAYGAVTLQTITTTQILLIGVGTTLGVVLMAVAQLPFLRGLGAYRFSFSIKHPSVRKMARLSVFVIGYVITNQLGYLVVQWLANRVTGGYSAYVSAFTFFMLPHGLFAVSLITALLPEMSEHAVNQRWDDFRDRLSLGVRATALLILPAAVGYFILSEPIVTLLLKRGVITARSVELVSGVLRVFVVGLVPFSLFQLFLRAFYALHDTKTPFLINLGAVTVNTAVNVPLFLWLGVRGLAAGHAIAYSFGSILQGTRLRSRIGGLDGRRILASGARIAAAALGMGVAVLAALRLVGELVDTEAAGGAAAAVLVPVAVGLCVYGGLAVMLRVQELSFLRSVIIKRSGNRD